MKEKWKDIIGYEGCYKISNLKRIVSLPRSVKKGWCKHKIKAKLMRQFGGKTKRIHLCKDGIKRTFNVDDLFSKVWGE